MPHVDIQFQYNLQLKSNEMRLVLMALEGRLLKDDDKAEAKELAKTLDEQKRTRLTSLRSKETE